MVTGPLLLAKVTLPPIVRSLLQSCPLAPFVVTEANKLLGPDTEMADSGVIPPTAAVNVFGLPLLTVKA